MLSVEFIASVGFPIAVASYLLIRMEKNISELTKAVVSLTQLIETRKI